MSSESVQSGSVRSGSVMSCFGCFGQTSGGSGSPSSPSSGEGVERRRSRKTSLKDEATGVLLAALDKSCKKQNQNNKAAVIKDALLRVKTTGNLKETNGLTQTLLEKRVECLQRCLDACWEPLLATLGSASATSQLDWGDTTIRGIHEHFWKTFPDTVLQDISLSTGLSLDALEFYLEEAQQRKLPVSDDVFQNNSINAFMKYIAVVLNRTVTQLSQANLEQTKQQFGHVLQQLGLGVNIQCVLDADSLTTLIYLLHKTGRDERKFAFHLHRGKPFENAFAQFSENSDVHSERCKLFPLFFDQKRNLAGTGTTGEGEGEGEGEGGTSVFEEGEGHGPRKEFFDLVSNDLAQNEILPVLFKYNRSMGKYWFNLKLAKTDEELKRYSFVGWLMAQTFFNRTKLHIDFAEVIFSRLLMGDRFVATMECLANLDPEAARSIQNIERLSQVDFDVMLDLEGKKGMSKQAFIEDSVKSVLLSRVQWQFDALCEGFHSVIDSESLGEYFSSSKVLAYSICGESTVQKDFKVQDVFLVVCDEELGEQWSLLSEVLWDTVNVWPVEKKLEFVKFVSGSKRLPLPKTETLKVELPFFAFSGQEHANLLRTLPQAHTCENLLELPNYLESLLVVKGKGTENVESMKHELGKVIDDRLTFAVSNCDSYGLDTFSADSSERTTTLKPIEMSKSPVKDPITFGEKFKSQTVTNSEILSVYRKEDILSLTAEEEALNNMIQKDTPQKEEGSEDKSTIYDATIDEMADELGISL